MHGETADKKSKFSTLLRMGVASLFLAGVAGVMQAPEKSDDPRLNNADSLAGMDNLQSFGIKNGIFNGTVENKHAVFSIFGNHARINPLLSKKPSIEFEHVWGAMGAMFYHPIDTVFGGNKFADAMTYMHERAHIEYQTAMEKRIDMPGMTQADQDKIAEGMRKTDASIHETRTRGHGAMHERFAEIYGAYALIRMMEPEADSDLKSYFKEREQTRDKDTKINNTGGHIEFAHDLGRAMAVVNAADFETIRTMAPDQLKTLALRQASLVFLADAKNDSRLPNWLGRVITDDASKALWDGAGKMTGVEIAARAAINLPAARDCAKASTAPIESNKFSSNAPKCGKPSV